MGVILRSTASLPHPRVLCVDGLQSGVAGDISIRSRRNHDDSLSTTFSQFQRDENNGQTMDDIFLDGAVMISARRVSERQTYRRAETLSPITRIDEATSHPSPYPSRGSISGWLDPESLQRVIAFPHPFPWPLPLPFPASSLPSPCPHPVLWRQARLGTRVTLE